MVGSHVTSEVRALLALMILAAPAAADPVACVPNEIDDDCLAIAVTADADHALACFASRNCGTRVESRCLVIEPATGAIVGARGQPPATFEINDDEKSVLESAAFKRCGAKCVALEKRLAERETLTATIDPTGKLLFEIESGYPTHGNTWSLVTGKRVSRFPMDNFDGPPPPTSFDHVELVGRHVFVGEPDEDYPLTYDIYTGAMGQLFQQRHIGNGLVIENDSTGRLDLVDYAQVNHPRIAVRRVKSSKQGDPTLVTHTVQFGTQAVIVIEDPQITLLVDTRKRTISKPRALPRCAAN